MKFPEINLSEEAMKEVMNKQKGVYKEIIGKAAANAFSGKGTVSLSLPVKIFEPVSTLERVAEWFSFAPHYLTLAA